MASLELTCSEVGIPGTVWGLPELSQVNSVAAGAVAEHNLEFLPCGTQPFIHECVISNCDRLQ